MTVFQPKGPGTPHKEGTILVNAPRGAGSGALDSEYTIDTYVTNLPTTGEINAKYEVRFTGCDICN